MLLFTITINYTMYKYHFTDESKHTAFFMYEEYNGFFITFSYEDYAGRDVKSFVSSNLKHEVDVDLRQLLNYIFREQFDIETAENNVPESIVKIACNAIDGYFR